MKDKAHFRVSGKPLKIFACVRDGKRLTLTEIKRSLCEFISMVPEEFDLCVDGSEQRIRSLKEFNEALEASDKPKFGYMKVEEQFDEPTSFSKNQYGTMDLTELEKEADTNKKSIPSFDISQKKEEQSEPQELYQEKGSYLKKPYPTLDPDSQKIKTEYSVPDSDEQFEMPYEKCSRCEEFFSPSQKIYITVSHENYHQVLCGRCDGENSEVESYGVSYKQFRSKMGKYGIRSIYILRNDKNSAFCNMPVEEALEIKTKVEELMRIVLLLRPNEKKEILLPQLKKVVMENPKLKNEELLAQFQRQ